MEKIKVGISACLLGHNVRFNGSHCHKKWLTQHLAKYVDYHVVCPEVASGMSTPRPSMFLLENQETEHPQLIIRDDKHTEISELLLKTSQKLIDQCDGISGFIVKRGSPSCGAGSANLYNQKFNIQSHHQDGLFVQALKTVHPHLPIEDEGRLNDPLLQEHFIKRVYLYHSAQLMLDTVNHVTQLQAFHVKHKMLLRLHSSQNQKILGRLIAQASMKKNLDDLKQQYFNVFIQSFDKVATSANHYTLLQRCFRGINYHLSKLDREDIQENLKAYLKGLTPLSTPMAILRHYAKRYQQTFISNQSYLYPYPDELGLMRGV